MFNILTWSIAKLENNLRLLYKNTLYIFYVILFKKCEMNDFIKKNCICSGSEHPRYIVNFHFDKLNLH